MSPTKAYVVLAALLVAGCASAPEVAEEAQAAAPVSSAAIVPDAILDANELIARTPPQPICRDMLKRNSNAHETRCMSAEDWKKWEQVEAQNAASLVRMMQGGAYR